MKNLSHANHVALLEQAVRKEFPSARLVQHDTEVTVLIGEPPGGVSMAITHPQLESMSLLELVTSVVACAKARGIESASAIAAAKRAAT